MAIADFPAPNPDASRGRANGRGIAVVGNAIFYSLADSSSVYQSDVTTHADLGIAFATPLAPGINSIASDGTTLWLVASQPANASLPADDRVYQYSTAGVLLQTLVLARPANSNLARDGIEVTPNGIVANRGGMPYDVYDFNGRLQQPAWITGAFRSTGIAFDGTSYIISDAVNGRLAIFDPAGKFLRAITLTGAAIPNGLVDLAVAQATLPSPTFTAASLGNAASYASGTIAPGEIVTIFGSHLGSPTLATPVLNTAGTVDSLLAGTRVLFDGVAAPMIFTSANQISAVVPYGVAGRNAVQVEVEFEGTRSAPVTVSVAPSTPGIFTLSGLGSGPGAILNEDSTINSSANAAKPGSIVVIYATGEGQTNPGGVDGRLAVAPLPAPLLPVSATIGNLPAIVIYAGAAPTLVSGVFQVNLRVPVDATAGNLPVCAASGQCTESAGSYPRGALTPHPCVEYRAEWILKIRPMSCLSRAQTAGLLFFVSTLFGADLPYVGKWRLNPAKSNLAGTTITYTQQGAQLSYREGDQSYEFRADGHDYVTPFGYSRGLETSRSTNGGNGSEAKQQSDPDRHPQVLC